MHMKIRVPGRGCRRQPSLRRQAGPMACRRELRGRTPLVTAMICVGSLAVLSSLITLSNGIVTGRRAMRALLADKAYLETQLGLLEQQWNDETSRACILDRAQRKLGLQRSDAPGLIVVMADQAGADEQPLWQRVVAAVGSGDRVAAAAAADRPR
jgi:hypothetical protein